MERDVVRVTHVAQNTLHRTIVRAHRLASRSLALDAEELIGLGHRVTAMLL